MDLLVWTTRGQAELLQQAGHDYSMAGRVGESGSGLALVCLSHSVGCHNLSYIQYQSSSSTVFFFFEPSHLYTCHFFWQKQSRLGFCLGDYFWAQSGQEGSQWTKTDVAMCSEQICDLFSPDPRCAICFQETAAFDYDFEILLAQESQSNRGQSVLSTIV